MGNGLKRIIYDSTSYNSAIDPAQGGQYGITFAVNVAGGTARSKPVKVTGILNRAISWGTKANWKTHDIAGMINTIASGNSLFKTANGVVEFVSETTGRSITNSGLFTRKFYNSSCDLSITPSFRVFDFDNLGLPIAAGLLFTSLCLPKRREGDTMQAAELVRVVTENAVALVKVGTGAAKKVVAGIPAASKFVTKSEQVLDDTVQDVNQNIAGSTVNWTVQPATINVQIGTWLTIRNMVLTSVNVTYSAETTENGPLFADFELSLVTREDLTFNDAGQIDQLQLTLGGGGAVTANNKEPKVSFATPSPTTR